MRKLARNSEFTFRVIDTKENSTKTREKIFESSNRGIGGRFSGTGTRTPTLVTMKVSEN